MKFSLLTFIFPWKACLYLSLALLPVLIVLNFYGLYSNQFYLLKVDNYIFPMVSILHFVYLYALWFKIRESEYPDHPLRNVEYGMYAVLIIYLFQLADTGLILNTYSEFQSHIIPETFLPVGVLMFGLQLLLILLTFASFGHRRKQVGEFDFDAINENLDSWPNG